MANLLIRIDDGIAKLEEVAIFLIFAGLVSGLFIQVLFRFVIEEPLGFTEELSRTLLIWATFIGAARAMHYGEHFLVDFAVNALPEAGRRIVGLLIDLITVLFLGVLVWIGWRTALGGALQTLPVLGVSVMVQTIAMPLGLALMALHCGMTILRRHRSDAVRTCDDALTADPKTNEAL